jgi:hypothetical protein
MPAVRAANSRWPPRREHTGCAIDTWATIAGGEETLFARKGPVDELVDQHKGARGQRLAQRTYRADRDEIGDARALERIDVGAEVDFARRYPVAAAMAGQEDHRLSA